MSNSNFDKNGVDNSGTHWFQYAAFTAKPDAKEIKTGVAINF